MTEHILTPEEQAMVPNLADNDQLRALNPELVGTPISRPDALRIAHQIMTDAEQGRKDAADKEADRGHQTGKGQRRTAKMVKDTAIEGASGKTRPRTSRGGQDNSIRLTAGPLPKACSKNARGHWATAAAAAKEFRFEVYLSAFTSIITYRHMPWGHITVDLCLCKKRVPRRIDPDNVWSMFKPGLDGLVDAGIVADDDTEHVTLGTITTEKADTDETMITIWRR